MELKNLIEYADEKEAEALLYPLWLSHYTTQHIVGGEVVPYSELLKGAKKQGTADKPSRSIDDIEAELLPVIEKYRKEAATNG